jgi:hypothetical protein
MESPRVWHIAGLVWHRQRGHDPLATLWLPPPDVLDRESIPLTRVLGMHLTQVATIGWGCDCRSHAFEMRAGSVPPSIGLAPTAWRPENRPSRPDRPPNASRTRGRRGPWTLMRASVRRNHQILGLPESSAYPVPVLSDTAFRRAGVRHTEAESPADPATPPPADYGTSPNRTRRP